MTFLDQIKSGLANAQLEASKHVNAANIHRTIGNVQNRLHLGMTAPQLSYLHSIAGGLGNQATREKQGSLDSAIPSIADNCPRVEVRMTPAKDASIEAKTHTGTGSAATNEKIIGECSSIATARRDADEACGSINDKSAAGILRHKDTCTCTCENNAEGSKMDTDDSNQSFMDGAQVAARRLGKTAWENPLLTAATVVTGTGLLVVAAPAILTAPIMGIAGAAGFTPAGIVASSAASAMHASIGNVAVGSVFATLQSAATGGYGVAMLTGTAQAAGGAMAGVGGVGGIVTYLKGKPKPEVTDEKESESTTNEKKSEWKGDEKKSEWKDDKKKKE